MNYNLQFITQNKEVCFDIEYTEEPINNSIINEFINDVRITTYGTKEVEYEGFIVRLDEVAKDRYKDLFAKYTKYNRFKKLLQLKNLIEKSTSNNYMAVIFDKQLSHIQLKQTFAYLSELETKILDLKSDSYKFSAHTKLAFSSKLIFMFPLDFISSSSITGLI